TFIDRQRECNGSEGEKFLQCAMGNIILNTRMSNERCKFRGEDKGVLGLGVVKRFFPEPIATAKKCATPYIVKRECPHAVEMLRQFTSPFAVTQKKHFRIGVIRPEFVSELFQLIAQFAVIVDFAVKNNH